MQLLHGWLIMYSLQWINCHKSNIERRLFSNAKARVMKVAASYLLLTFLLRICVCSSWKNQPCHKERHTPNMSQQRIRIINNFSLYFMALTLFALPWFFTSWIIFKKYNVEIFHDIFDYINMVLHWKPKEKYYIFVQCKVWLHWKMRWHYLDTGNHYINQLQLCKYTFKVHAAIILPIVFMFCY